MCAFTKKRREVEPRWVSEYIAKFYPKFEVRPRCPLGPIPENLVKLHGLSKATAVHRPWRPEVDALVLLPRHVLLIEAKIQKYMDGLSKLPVYRELIPVTPELQEYKDFAVMCHLLVPVVIPWIEEAAYRMKVDVKTWAPDWLKEIWRERDTYWTPEAVMKREERKKTLDRLGYD